MSLSKELELLKKMNQETKKQESQRKNQKNHENYQPIEEILMKTPILIKSSGLKPSPNLSK